MNELEGLEQLAHDQLAGLYTAHNAIQEKLVTYTMLEMAAVAATADARAAFIGLATGDQDMSGYQTPVAVVGRDLSTRLLVEVEDEGDIVDALFDMPVSNLDDATQTWWLPFTVGFVDNRERYNNTTSPLLDVLKMEAPGSDWWLDVNLILRDIGAYG